MTRILDRSGFAENYPAEKSVLEIAVDSPLTKRARLVELAGALPPDLVEFNPGDLPVTLSPDNIPQSDISAAETIEKIGTVKSWMTLRNVENDPEYKALMDSVIDALAPEIEAATGPILRREAFIFISSPGAVTPFHFDEEHNILIQIEGTKDFVIYSQHDRELASQQDLERFHAGGHRNLTVDPELLSRGETIAMRPGTALYVPPLAPHYVRVTGDEPSLSLSITWRSNASKRTCYLHQINHRLRERGGSPRFPGDSPLGDQLKIWRASAAARLQRLTGRGGDAR